MKAPVTSVRTGYNGAIAWAQQNSLLSSLGSNAGFFLHLLISQRLCGNPVTGAALALSAQMALCILAVFTGPAKAQLARSERVKYAVIAPPALLFSSALLLVFPWMTRRGGTGMLTLYALCQMLGSALFIGTPLAAALWRRNRKGLLWGCVYALACVLCVAALWGRDMWAALLAAMGLGLTALGIGRNNDPLPANTRHTAAQVRNASAVRHFWAMNANIHVAAECSVQLLLCYLVTLPVAGVWDAAGRSIALLLLFYASEMASRRFLHSKRLGDMGRNSLYIAFALLWLFINLRVNQHAERLGPWDIYAVLAVASLCIAMLFSVIGDMSADIRTLQSLLDAPAPEETNRVLRASFNQWTQYVSRFSLLVVLGPLALAQEFSTVQSINVPAILGKYALPLLPGFFLLLGLGAALRQPLTRQYELKLKKYRELLRDGRVNHALEERLRLVLVQKYSKRMGIQILKFVLRPFFKLKVQHLDRVNPDKFPAVFLCNHSEIFGPMAAVLNLPYYIRPWIINEMVDDELIWEHTKGTVDRQTWLPAPLRRWIARIVVPVTAWCMRSMEPIPVFRSNIREITRTLMASADALEAEDNILIFPEDPTKTDGYVREGVGAFYSGFVSIAKAYHRQTGRAVTFYSLFADKRRRTLSFSHGHTFNPNVPFHEEKERIASLLRHEMIRLAALEPEKPTN